MKYEVIILSRTPTTVLSLDDAKRELDITFEDDDALIQSHIDSAVEWVETYTGLLLSPAVVEMIADRLASPLRLPRGPVLAAPTLITVDGVAVTGFRGVGGSPYAVLPASATLWPSTVGGLGAVVVRFNAGFAEGTVPAGILGAIRAILNIYYDKPTGTELRSQWDGVERMLSTYRVRSL